MGQKLKPGTVLIEVIDGVEGPSLYIGDYDSGHRLAGPKPRGGGKTIHSFVVRVGELTREASGYAAQASAPVAGEAHSPVRWLHTLLDENGDPIRERVTSSPNSLPFGVPGGDYSAGCRVTVQPLYAAPQASEAVRDREDAARWRWATASDSNAEGLYCIVMCHGGYQEKINERADFYRAALSAQPGAQKKCNCATCRPHSVEMRMILCEVCGDKRCPHAEDHRNACTAQHPDNKDGGAVYG